MLEARGLRKRFGAVAALDGFELSVAAGEICGLLGHNGAGKTTFARICAGLERPDGGRVLLTMLRPVYARLGAAGGGAPIDQQAPGTAVMFTLLALDVAGQSLLSERTWHTWDRLRAGSVGRLTVLVGKAIPLTVLFALQQIVLFAFADAAFGFDIAAASWRLPLTVALWGLCVSGLGLAVGAWTRTQGQLSAAADVGALAVTCLSGSLVPLAILPHWVSHVAPWTPGYWALRGFQGAVESGGHAEFLEALGVLAVITVLAFAAASLRPMTGRR